ncbi:hypothetical protein GGR57DRAFT_102453 [Xylariaceae sp. FL1272]|nr:hypothetical protein GGR57DRAFT_102453 [Xylariaceae sp. FL1272]
MAGDTRDGEPHSNGEPPTLDTQNGAGILRQAKALQAEIQQFADHLATIYDGYFHKFPKNMHMSLLNDVAIEISNLESDVHSSDPMASHRISSNNLPFIQAVWDTAKMSENIIKMRHPIFSGPFKRERKLRAPGMRLYGIMSQGDSEPKRNQNTRSMRIDVIAEGGLTWYKVSALTNRRLEFDMAKEAVFCDDSEDEESNGVARDFSDVPLVKLAAELARISKGHQIRHQNPRPILVLPRIVEKESVQIHQLLDSCRDMGVTIICRDALSPAPPISQELLDRMAPSPQAQITPALNVDTSVLVALASDITHSNVEKQSWFGHSCLDHIDLEKLDPLAPKLFDILGGHELVCTREASSALARIVHHMGTNTENARAHLLLGVDDSMTREQRVENFRALSLQATSMPPDLQLPIRIVDSNEDDCQDHFLPPVQEKLDQLTEPVRSVFSYGWAKSLTTVTCNYLAAKMLERNLEELPSLDGLDWPSIWAFSSSRPLVGVRKGSLEKRFRKHVGDCRMQCNCGLEQLYGDTL